MHLEPPGFVLDGAPFSQVPKNGFIIGNEGFPLLGRPGGAAQFDAGAPPGGQRLARAL